MAGSNYTTLMMESLLRAQEVQRSILRAALEPGGDPEIVMRVMRGMEDYL